MQVWEKINSKWKKQKFVDFTGLLNKANPSDGVDPAAVI